MGSRKLRQVLPRSRMGPKSGLFSAGRKFKLQDAPLPIALYRRFILSLIRKSLPLSVACIVRAALAAQSPETPDWQTVAGGNMEFEVASVKSVAPDLWHPPNLPLDNRNAYVPGGHVSAIFPLWAYISFAYKFSPNQQRTALKHLPARVRSDSDRFAIEARAIKFVVPLSVPSVAGTHLHWSKGRQAAASNWSVARVGMSEPFSTPVIIPTRTAH